MTTQVFQGFEAANTTPIPDVLFDELLSEVTGTELKVLLYLMRRTWGFKKTVDAVSLSQFQFGITTKDGKVLDKGCGIKRRGSICDALASLEQKGYITSSKSKKSNGDNDISVYSIRFKDEVVSKPDYPSFKTGLPWYAERTTLVSKSDPQYITVGQQTVGQDSDFLPPPESRLKAPESITNFITEVNPLQEKRKLETKGRGTESVSQEKKKPARHSPRESEQAVMDEWDRLHDCPMNRTKAVLTKAKYLGGLLEHGKMTLADVARVKARLEQSYAVQQGTPLTFEYFADKFSAALTSVPSKPSTSSKASYIPHAKASQSTNKWSHIVPINGSAEVAV